MSAEHSIVSSRSALAGPTLSRARRNGYVFASTMPQMFVKFQFADPKVYCIIITSVGRPVTFGEAEFPRPSMMPDVCVSQKQFTKIVGTYTSPTRPPSFATAGTFPMA